MRHRGGRVGLDPRDLQFEQFQLELFPVGRIGQGTQFRDEMRFAFFRGSTRVRGVRGLLVAGATTIPGVGLPMCLISAELVLKRVRGDRSAGPLQVPV